MQKVLAVDAWTSLRADDESASAVALAPRIVPGLGDVSETMLWSLFNRASEAGRSGGILCDPDSIRIHQSIDYDFRGRFGDPAGSLAVRAAAIDQALRCWLERHPDGCVVSLGEGLETQVRRVDNGRMRWLSVDLPAAMHLRERFLTPTDRFRHMAISVLDPAWMDVVDQSAGVFIVAQGLLMYLQPESVRSLLCGLADRFPGAEMVFDAVPRWFSRLTSLGLQQTPCYCLPPMPWGINRDEVPATLRRWHKRLDTVAFLDYRLPHEWPWLLAPMLRYVPFVQQATPTLVHVAIAQQPPRIQPMTLTDSADTDTVADVFTAATQMVGRNGDLARAAGQIVSKRVALGVAAAINPLAADHHEFGRMVPEKFEAFTTAGMIMLERSGQANLRIAARLASGAVTTTVRAMQEMTVCHSPMALVEMQGRYASAWFEQVASSFVAMGMLTLDAQDAAMAPIRQTVAANAERLANR